MIIVAVFRIKVQNDFSLKILDICFHCLLVFSVACKNSTSIRFSFLLSKLLLLSWNFMIFLLSLMSYIYIIIPLGKGFKWSLSVLDGPFKSKVLALAPRNVFPSLYYFFLFSLFGILIGRMLKHQIMQYILIFFLNFLIFFLAFRGRGVENVANFSSTESIQLLTGLPFLKIVFVRYNLCTRKFTYFKCIIQWLLVNL